ncbi:MAG: OmpA family protein [Bacteroidetes bacterium]|nr:OmpA family protein [Bacteroidota bacterium]
MRLFLGVVIVLFGCERSVAQSDEIIVSGKVKQTISGKGIKSKIVYKSYPTGSLSGSFVDSTFSFSIFGSSKYQVTAAAEGFIPRTIIVDPKESKNHSIVSDIELTPTNQTVRLNHLIFDMGRAVIKPESFTELDELVAMMKADTKLVIQLEGHTDSQGSAEKNLVLSQDRVDAVKKYLSSKGISKDRIKTKAFGGTQPLSTDKTEEARALNRRVEMRVLKD